MTGKPVSDFDGEPIAGADKPRPSVTSVGFIPKLAIAVPNAYRVYVAGHERALVLESVDHAPAQGAHAMEDEGTCAVTALDFQIIRSAFKSLVAQGLLPEDGGISLVERLVKDLTGTTTVDPDLVLRIVANDPQG